ncbi:hypothetical protein HMPREF2791_04070 [Corynebacterium sp. HMSC034A01]|nr:hypothetical protein HMPREF2791_04070 [Corynebacterium sp. HMSC034A01]
MLLNLGLAWTRLYIINLNSGVLGTLNQVQSRVNFHFDRQAAIDFGFELRFKLVAFLFAQLKS